MFHHYYLRIEEIHMHEYKSEYIEPIKCDVIAFEADHLIPNDDSRLYGESMPKELNDVSDSDNDFFGNHGNH